VYARAFLLPLILLAGCSSSPDASDASPVAVGTSRTSELTVIAWSNHLQRAVPAIGTVTFVDDGTTYALNTAGDAGQTLTGLEPGRYRVTFRKRKTDGTPKRIDGEEAVYLEPGERRTITVVVVDPKDDIG
jgi:hypothetical protein